MTGINRPVPHRRLSDQGWCGKTAQWWREYGQLVMGAWLLVVSAAVLVVALQFYSSQRATAEAAKVSCQRSMEFGHGVADDYEARGVFTTKQLAAYRASIPKSCPK